MEKETIVITTGEHSSCLKETKFCGDPVTDCVSIQVSRPESVYIMDGHRMLYTESDLKAERQAGQNEAWALAQRILTAPSEGGWENLTLDKIFGSSFPSNVVAHNSYSEAKEKLHAHERHQLSTGDLVRILYPNSKRFDYPAIVLRVNDDTAEVCFEDGITMFFKLCNLRYICTVGLARLFEGQ